MREYRALVGLCAAVVFGLARGPVGVAEQAGILPAELGLGLRVEAQPHVEAGVGQHGDQEGCIQGKKHREPMSGSDCLCASQCVCVCVEMSCRMGVFPNTGCELIYVVLSGKGMHATMYMLPCVCVCVDVFISTLLHMTGHHCQLGPLRLADGAGSGPGGTSRLILPKHLIALERHRTQDSSHPHRPHELSGRTQSRLHYQHYIIKLPCSLAEGSGSQS